MPAPIFDFLTSTNVPIFAPGRCRRPDGGRRTGRCVAPSATTQSTRYECRIVDAVSQRESVIVVCGPISHPAPIARGAPQRHARADRRVRADRHARVDRARWPGLERDAVLGVRVDDPALRDGRRPSRSSRVLTPIALDTSPVSVRRTRPPPEDHREDPGEVALAALGLADLVEGRRTGRGREGVCADVDLADGELLVAHAVGVLGLHDPLDRAVARRGRCARSRSGRAPSVVSIVAGRALLARELPRGRRSASARSADVAGEDHHRRPPRRRRSRAARIAPPVPSPSVCSATVDAVGQARGDPVAGTRDAHDPSAPRPRGPPR